MASLFEELGAKLEAYNGQLQTIEKLLVANPGDAQLSKLKSDVSKAIDLTTSLRRKHQGSIEAAAIEADPISHETSAENFSVGGIVEALFDGRWFPAVIEAIARNANVSADAHGEDMYDLFFIGYGNRSQQPHSSLRTLEWSLPRVDSSLLAPGFRCEGRFSEDGKFYACTVLKRTDYGVRVEFTLDGTIEELPLQYLRCEPSAGDDNDGAKTETGTGARAAPEVVRKAGAEKEPEAGALPAFIAAKTFNGPKEFYEFKRGDLGVGYYKSTTVGADTSASCDNLGNGNGSGSGASTSSSSGSISAANDDSGAATTIAPNESSSIHRVTAEHSAVLNVARKVQVKQIPDKLAIQPDDSEAERERKRKRVRAIKSANRHAEITNERNEKMNSWQSFNSGMRGTRVQGSMSSLRRGRDSIFRSTESGRVGVVGSGSGTTEFEQRKKFKAPK